MRNLSLKQFFQSDSEYLQSLGHYVDFLYFFPRISKQGRLWVIEYIAEFGPCTAYPKRKHHTVVLSTKSGVKAQGKSLFKFIAKIKLSNAMRKIGARINNQQFNDSWKHLYTT